MARSSECTERHAQKVIDSAGIVRDAILQQQPVLANRVAILRVSFIRQPRSQSGTVWRKLVRSKHAAASLCPGEVLKLE
jgi:hypothetical protein